MRFPHLRNNTVVRAIAAKAKAAEQHELQRAADVTKLAESGLVDTQWYYDQYPDVKEQGVDAAWHYMNFGAREGRDPGPHFNTIWYVSENPECFTDNQNPLLHYIEYGLDDKRSPVPIEEAQSFESFLRVSKSGRLFGLRFHDYLDHVHVKISQPTSIAKDKLPLPPLDLCVRIGSPTLELFDQIGLTIKNSIVRSLPKSFSFENSRCLDFGCGVGRVIRHFANEAEAAEIWGCDIDGTSIRWNVENLGTKFRFFQIGDMPALPLEENSCDLIYAIGVFSQLYDQWHQWAMELRRVLKPNGILIVSFAGQGPFEEMMGKSFKDSVDQLGMYIQNPFHPWNKGGPTVFVSSQWIKTMWGNIFDIDYIALNGLLDYHTICLMRKPAIGKPLVQEVPIYELGSQQQFNANATGRIHSIYDEKKTFLSSYGIEGSGKIIAYGWIVFRNDQPQSGETFVDDVNIPGEFFFDAVLNYRDWNSLEYRFAVTFDASEISSGKHELRLSITNKAGDRHQLRIPLVIH